MQEIKLLHSKKVALVDDEDFIWLSQHTWYLYKSKYNNFYASTVINGISIQMQLLLLKSPDKRYQTDHIDRNGLNNQRRNLRIATLSQQNANKDIYENNTSGYKGVTFHKQTQKWRARLTVKKITMDLGLFHSKEEAAKVYNNAALKHFGEFAVLNEVE